MKSGLGEQLRLDLDRELACCATEVLLLSFRYEPFRLIREGSKKYEYRRKFPNRPTTAFIYVSSPVKAVSGWVELGQPIVGSPWHISEIAESERKGWGESTLAYLAGLAQGYAVPIRSFQETERVTLDELKANFRGFRPPQSYLILNKMPELLVFLMKRTGIAC